MSRLRFAVLSAFAVVAGCQCPVAGGGGDGGAPFDGGSGGNDGGGGSDGGSDGGTGGGGGGSRTDGGSFGGGGTPLAVDGGAGGSGTNVVLLPDGGVALGTSAESYTYMWIANNAQGWVSKYDTRTAKEVARYFSVIPKDCSNSPGGPPCAGGAPHDLRADRTHFPSRTAIDIAGDMWVANRAMLTTASVTKIANELSRCVDRNGNGRIDTSSDRNGDGEISRDPAAGEFIVPTDFADVRHYDECVLFTQPLDGPVPQGGVGARAIAVSAGFEGGGAGDVWVGIFHTKRIYRLDSSTGVPVAVNSSGAQFLELGFGAYGAIVDRSQRLWVVQSGTPRLALIDTLAGSIVDDNIRAPDASRCGAYALSVDGKGRVWLPGMYAGARACRYDPSTSQWQDFDFSAARSARGTVFTYGRGIAVDVDGKVYMSGTGLREGSPLAWQWQAQLIRFDAETGAILPFGTQEFIDVTNPTSTYASIGVGLDIDGHPWVNNQSGNAMKVDKNTGAVTFTPQQPEGLYTYSDFTGYVLRNYTAPRGTYSHTLTGCGPNAEWTTLRWSATVPTGTALEARVWTATTRAGLDVPGVVVKGPFSSSPVDLRAAGLPAGEFLRLEFVFTARGNATSPVLHGYQIERVCTGVLN